jgi:hypothetical protein
MTTPLDQGQEFEIQPTRRRGVVRSPGADKFLEAPTARINVSGLGFLIFRHTFIGRRLETVTFGRQAAYSTSNPDTD